jgi:uncharacterized protein (DUF305 family)
MEHAHHHPYARLVLMTALSYVAMYALMYAMVNAFDSVYLNINNAYMAGLMAAPMMVIELVVMRSMYPNRALNAALIVAGAVALAALWVFTREQTAVSDRQFLRSMIPHHSGAILMCREAAIRDAEIRELCRTIIASQQREIDQMKDKLSRLDLRKGNR